MTATYCVAGRWYYIKQATLVGGNIPDDRDRYQLWTGWIWVSEKKYHTESTVTLIGITSHPHDPDLQARRVVLEMRRGLTVQTLKDGPPVYVINEQSLI